MIISENLIQVDHLVRDLVPIIFDAAGLKGYADEIRKCHPLRNKEAVKTICEFLRNMHDGPLTNIHESSWSTTIREILFWSEASIWTAVDNSQDCSVCVLFVKRNAEEIRDKTVVH